MALMCGIDIPVPELSITLHQPKIREIAFIGEKDFFIGVQCLCINKDLILQDKSILANTNNFQIFMTIMEQDEDKEKRNAVRSLLLLIFPSIQNVLFTPRSLILQSASMENLTIDEQNFTFLQEISKQVFCFKQTSKDSFNPANEKARQIAEKLMRGRKKVAELNGSDKASIFSQYLSILTIGLNSMSLQDLMDLTMYQLYDLIERYSLYLNWDIDIRSRMAGAKVDKPVENWMKQIH